MTDQCSRCGVEMGESRVFCYSCAENIRKEQAALKSIRTLPEAQQHAEDRQMGWTYICPNCDQRMVPLNACRVRCARCGYMEDCS